MLAIKWKNNSNGVKGILLILICAMLASTAMCNAYPLFRLNAQKIMDASKQEKPAAEEAMVVGDDFQRYLLSSIYYLNYEITPDMDAYEYFTQNYDTNRLSAAEQDTLNTAAAKLMKTMRNQYVTENSMNNYRSFAHGVDKDFGQDPTGELRSAIYDSEDATDSYKAGIIISYDSRGIPSIRSSWGMDLTDNDVMSYLAQASMYRLMQDNGMDEDEIVEDAEYIITDGNAVFTSGDMTDTTVSDTEPTETYEEAVDDASDRDGAALLKQIPLPMIQNTTFAFGIVSDNGYGEGSWQDYWIERHAYQTSGIVAGAIIIAIFMMVLALVLQNMSSLELRKNRLFLLPTEVNIILWLWGFLASLSVLEELAVETLYNGTDGLAATLASMGFGNASGGMAVVLIWIAWTAYALGWYWMMAAVLPYMTHPVRTVKEHSMIVRFSRQIKNWFVKVWNWATEIRLGKDLTNTILKLVAVNGLIVMLLCCIWFGGIVGALLYSVLLFILIKNKCGKVQEDYYKLLDATRQIADGDLNASMDEEMGLFNPVRDELASIQDGFQKAVKEEVRSRNMKTELITNVSHDLKTPLTAIITYVDLLKKEDLTDEERREYVATLEKKSQRLKSLIEDLFEVSKATTDNLVMNYAEVDLINLIKEVRLENQDKIASSSLDFRWNLPDEKCILKLDPQRTFRIIDNLVQNILKYSMPHSRVYIALLDQTTQVTVSFKNMSATEMNFTPEEITERFVRGDLSRNTEGSGLGLAIAQSFTELQGGEFKVETDGDLFKVTLIWKKLSQTEEETER